MNKCEKCGSETKNPKFCSHSCAAAVNNIGVRRHGKPRAINNCLCCGSPLLKRTQKRYCDNRCHALHRWNELKQRIVSSGAVPPRTDLKVARRYLKETRGWSCTICGITHWNGAPAPLEVDHIDGNSNNHNVANLRLVCGNCGMQLPTYKGRNRGKGRHVRKLRYAAGESY